MRIRQYHFWLILSITSLSGCNLQEVVGHNTLYDFKLARNSKDQLILQSRLIGSSVTTENTYTRGTPYELIISLQIPTKYVGTHCKVVFDNLSITNQESNQIFKLDPLSKNVQRSSTTSKKSFRARSIFYGLDIPYANYILRFGYTLSEDCGIEPLEGIAELLNETDYKDYDVTVWDRISKGT